VTEACRPDVDEEFGEDRLAATLAELSQESAQSIIESINQRVTDFTKGSPPADDITLVVAKRV
jgi:serine phosphatase RsbU (regulator of sigma subunit)